MGTINDFGQRLQYVMDQEKMNQNEVAEGIGVSRSRISDWLNAKVTDPRRGTLQKLADFFGCNIEWLATGKGEPFPSTSVARRQEAAHQHERESQITETELQVLRAYRKLAKLDYDLLLEIQSWINEEEIKRPGFPAWFRLEFENRFPEYLKWKGEQS